MATFLYVYSNMSRLYVIFMLDGKFNSPRMAAKKPTFLKQLSCMFLEIWIRKFALKKTTFSHNIVVSYRYCKFEHKNQKLFLGFLHYYKLSHSRDHILLLLLLFSCCSFINYYRVLAGILA